MLLILQVPAGDSHREARKDAWLSALREILLTHVVGEQQTLARFLKAFDKERWWSAQGAGIPDLSHILLITRSLERKKRISFVDLLPVRCGRFPCGYMTIKNFLSHESRT